MDIKICPECNGENQVTAEFCKLCDKNLKSVVSTKMPINEANNTSNHPFEEGIEKQPNIEKSSPSSLLYRFLLGFFGWFIGVSLFLGIVLALTKGMGPAGIILVPFTLVPLLGTMLAIFLAFLLPKLRSRRVHMRKNGVIFGIISAYVFNFVINLIVNSRTDPLTIVGSILGWPFYIVWVDNLFSL